MDFKTDTEEFEPMQLQMTVTPEFGQGYGNISAADRLSDEDAQEAAAEGRNYIETVEKGTPCGCIDGRCVLHCLNGLESKLGPKTAGGSGETALFALETDGAFDESSDIYTDLFQVINMLEDDGQLPVRFHIDADHEVAIKDTILKYREEFSQTVELEDFIKKILALEIDVNDSGCGMGDQFVGAFNCIADAPRTYKDANGDEQTETADQVAARLAFMKSVGALIEGDAFNDATFDAHAKQATALLSGKLTAWNSIKALIVADRALLERGVKDGIMGRLEVLETSEAGVHGHTESLLMILKKAWTTFNQTKYARQTGKEAFTFDEWTADVIAHATAASMSKIEERIAAVSQGVVEANLAGAYQLCDGTQRAVVYS